MLLGALLASVVLFNVPYGMYVLYPFKLFATWLHETGHGVAALLAGGEFQRMVIRADTSGTAYHTATSGTLARAFVASAGYMGTTIFGGLLLWLGTKSERSSRMVLAALGVTMVAMDVVFMRNLFGLVAIGAIGVALVIAARKAGTAVASGILHLLAAQSCLNALLDIRVLFMVGTSTVPGQGRSDAATMQDLLLLPYWFWAALWMGLSVVLLSLALWRVWRREGRAGAVRAPLGAKATPAHSA